MTRAVWARASSLQPGDILHKLDALLWNPSNEARRRYERRAIEHYETGGTVLRVESARVTPGRVYVSAFTTGPLGSRVWRAWRDDVYLLVLIPEPSQDADEDLTDQGAPNEDRSEAIPSPETIEEKRNHGEF